MKKYIVETYYTCTFKTVHTLSNLDDNELSKIDQRNDGNVEVIDVKLNNRKTKKVGGKKDELREVIINELSEEADSEKPEAYELPALPEGITEEMLQENPMTEWWQQHCDENAYSQEIFQEGINKYIDSYLGNMPDIEREKEKLGENANARLDAVNSWASSFFSTEEYEAIVGTLGATAEGIEALERMMQTQKQSITSANQVAQPERPLTLEDVRGMMKDKRYYDPKDRDPAFVRKVDEAFARLYR